MSWVNNGLSLQDVDIDQCRLCLENEVAKICRDPSQFDAAADCKTDCEDTYGATKSGYDPSTKSCYCGDTGPSCNSLAGQYPSTNAKNDCGPNSVTGTPCIIASATTEKACKDACATFNSDHKLCGSTCYCPDPKAGGAVCPGGTAPAKCPPGQACKNPFAEMTHPDDPNLTPGQKAFIAPQLGITDKHTLYAFMCACDQVQKEVDPNGKFMDTLNKAIKAYVTQLSGSTPNTDLVDYLDKQKFLSADPSTRNKQITAALCLLVNALEKNKRIKSTVTADFHTNARLWMKQNLEKGSEFGNFIQVILQVVVWVALIHLFFRLVYPKGGDVGASLLNYLWLPPSFLKGSHIRVWLVIAMMIAWIIIVAIIWGTDRYEKTGTETKTTVTQGGTVKIEKKETTKVEEESRAQKFVNWLFPAAKDTWKSGFIILAVYLPLVGMALYWLLKKLLGGRGMAASWVFFYVGIYSLAFLAIFMNFIIATLVPWAELVLIIFYRSLFFFIRRAATNPEGGKWAKYIMSFMGLRPTDKWVMPFVGFITWIPWSISKIMEYAGAPMDMPDYYKSQPRITGVSNTDMWMS